MQDDFAGLRGESPGKEGAVVSPFGFRSLFLKPRAVLPAEEEKTPQRKQSPCSFTVSAFLYILGKCL